MTEGGGIVGAPLAGAHITLWSSFIANDNTAIGVPAGWNTACIANRGEDSP